MYGCPYCKTDMKKRQEYCILTGEATNGAVMCDFEYEYCDEYRKAREPLRGNTAEQIQTSIFGEEGEVPFKG